MKIKEITDFHILFDDGTKITDYHEQDCCEYVYADFEQLKTTAIMNEVFKREDLLNMVGVKDNGIKLKSYMIPCYNEQNGYYSDQLELIVTFPDGVKIKMDCAGFIENRID